MSDQHDDRSRWTWPGPHLVIRGWALLGFIISFPVRILENDGLLDQSTCIHLNVDMRFHLRLFQLVMILHLPAHWPGWLHTVFCST